MKKALLFFFLIISVIALAQQPKRVYITLDVSGSMTGNKYALANYTTQMIVTLCQEDDEVYMILYGDDMCLSKEKDPLKPIQKPMNNIKFGLFKGDSQFDDIIGFNKVYKPSKETQDWLFIIGDGIWGTSSSSYVKDCEKFSNTVKKGEINVCYLQTGESIFENNDFTEFVEPLGVVDIKKSSTKPETIKDGCDHFARKILGFSEVPLKVKSEGKKCISITTELPLSELYVVFQDEIKPNKLPKIEIASANGSELEVIHMGTPTTYPVKSNSKDVDLSGNVWHLKANGVIPANSEIKVCFDSNVKPSKVSVYPLVKDMHFNVGAFTLSDQQLQVKGQVSTICEDETSAKVRIELGEDSKDKLPPALLQKTEVVVKANNKEYKTKYKNGGFECEIDLIEDETQYYAECDCPGYFNYTTPIATIKKGKCEEVKPQEKPMEVKKMPKADFGSFTFNRLKEGPISATIQDTETLETLDPSKFDITVEVENGFLYEKPKVTLIGDTVLIDIRPKGEWCECLFPEDLNIKVTSTPKSGASFGDDKQYIGTEHPIHINVLKNRTWFSRCLWVLLTIMGLSLLIVYFAMLLRKNRFKKYARIKHTYMELVGSIRRESDEQEGFRLRRKGFLAWVNRWLVPFPDEKRTEQINTPPAGSMTFVAADSREYVNFTRASFDPDKMEMGDYDMENDEVDGKKPELIEMTDPIRITEKKRYEGQLIFDPGFKNDERGYRTFIGALILICAASIVTLLVLMIKSFGIF